MVYEQELSRLRNRIKELEDQVEHLRISRRVLMNLIEKVEREKRNLLSQLEKENKRLLHSNQRYANWLMHKNLKIVELEAVSRRLEEDKRKDYEKRQDNTDLGSSP